MRTSNQGLELLQQVEGSSDTICLDTANKATIGVGHLLTKDELTSGKATIGGVLIDLRRPVSPEEIQLILSEDLKTAEAGVEEFVSVPLNQNQFDALVMFVFNIGVPAFGRSTLLMMLNKGEYDKVPNQMKRWIHSGGKITKGLVNRREIEAKLFEGKS